MTEVASEQGGPDPPDAGAAQAVDLGFGEEPPRQPVGFPGADGTAEREAISAASASVTDGVRQRPGSYGDPVTRALRTSIATDVMRSTLAIDDLIDHAPDTAADRQLLADLRLQGLIHTYERREDEQTLRHIAMCRAAAKERVETWLIYAAIPGTAIGLYGLGHAQAILHGRAYGGAVTVVATSLVAVLSAAASFIIRRRAARRGPR